jgi:putative ubiquitin-RnfH superfamily antitoxin RatB of RatAB toxin-antitoxin module
VTAPTCIRVEVVFAEPERGRIRSFELVPPARVADALAAAAADPLFAGIDLRAAPVGIFGRRVDREQLLEAGDRVEILRPLAIDPRAARRARVQEARKRGAARPKR